MLLFLLFARYSIHWSGVHLRDDNPSRWRRHDSNVRTRRDLIYSQALLTAQPLLRLNIREADRQSTKIDCPGPLDNLYSRLSVLVERMTCKLWVISGVSYKIDYLADELNTYQHSIKVNENTKTKRPKTTIKLCKA